MDLLLLGIVIGTIVGFLLHGWAARAATDDAYLAGRLDEIADNQVEPR